MLADLGGNHQITKYSPCGIFRRIKTATLFVQAIGTRPMSKREVLEYRTSNKLYINVDAMPICTAKPLIMVI